MDIFLQVYFLVFTTLLGIIIGSFLNVVIYRVPAGRTIVKGHSMCMSCGHDLAAKDLIPIISWASLKGKCRYCGAPIASRYTKIESFTGVAFFIAALGLFREAAPAVLYPGLNTYTYYTIYFVMFVLALSAAISAMMIYYDTGKGYLGIAIWSVVFYVLASFVLPLILDLLSGVGAGNVLSYLASTGISLGKALVAAGLCFAFTGVWHKKYSVDELYMDITIMLVPMYSHYFIFYNHWLEFAVLALFYGLLRAITKGTGSDRKSGIIALCTFLVITLVHTICKFII